MTYALLVDDVPSILALLGSALLPFDIERQTACTLSDARQKIAQHGQPFLAILDVKLGCENGLDLVRNLAADVTIMVHTADDTLSAKDRALLDGRVWVQISKSTPLSELRALIRVHLPAKMIPAAVDHGASSIAEAKRAAKVSFMDYLMGVHQGLASGALDADASMLHQLRGAAAIHGFTKLATKLEALEEKSCGTEFHAKTVNARLADLLSRKSDNRL